MQVSDVIRDHKFDLKVGEWKNGHIPRSVFPLSRLKAKSYKFGSEYRWRVVAFETSKGKFRILLLLNEGKGIFRATLAAETSDQDLIVLCQHEFHQSEPGWHCHVSFEDVDKLPRGVIRSHLKRWPKSSSVHAEVEFKVTTTSALSFAARCFRFSSQGDLL